MYRGVRVGQGSAQCLAYPEGWLGGSDGKKKFVHLKCASKLWLSIENLVFIRRNISSVLDRGGGGCVCGSYRSPPPPSPVPSAFSG